MALKTQEMRIPNSSFKQRVYASWEEPTSPEINFPALIVAEVSTFLWNNLWIFTRGILGEICYWSFMLWCGVIDVTHVSWQLLKGNSENLGNNVYRDNLGQTFS